MDKRTAGIIAIVATILLCGLPGLVTICLGMLGMVGIFAPSPGQELTSSEKTPTMIFLVLMVLCSVVGILIPILIAIFTLRKPKSLPEVIDLNEPIPPPS